MLPVILAVIVSVIPLLILSRLHILVKMKYVKEQEEGAWSFELSLWAGRWKYNFSLPDAPGRSMLLRHLFQAGRLVEKSSSYSEPPKSSFQRFNRLIRAVYGTRVRVLALYPAVILSWGRALRWRQIHWHTQVGLGDPYHTAMAIGGLWSVKSIILAKWRSNAPLEVPDIQLSVKPNFSSSMWKEDFQCIFEMRLGHIMVTAVDIYKEMTKGGEIFARASNRGSDENRNGQHKRNG